VTDTELRLIALKAALEVNSVCKRPHDRVGDLMKNTQDIFEFLKTGAMPKYEQITDQSLQGGLYFFKRSDSI